MSSRIITIRMRTIIAISLITILYFARAAMSEEDTSGNHAAKVITVAATGIKGTDADYIGISGLQDAINSINDSSETNPYEIKLSGMLHAEVRDFIDHKLDHQKVIIPQKAFVTISGTNRDQDGIIAILPNDLDEQYRCFNIIVSNVSMTLKNLTLLGKNIRYPLHIYGGSAANKTFVLENCIIRHEGNTGKALAGWRQPRPFGVGLSSGFHFIVRNCDIYSEQNPPVYHGTNTPFARPASVLYENCKFKTGKKTENLVWLYSQGSGQINKITLRNISGSGTVGIGTGVWTPERLEEQIADHNEFEILMPDTPPLAYTYKSPGQALRIDSKSKKQGSSVRFDETSSAFPLLIGNPADSKEMINRYGLQQQYGYSFRDGGDGLSGYAIGTFSLQEDPIKYRKGIYISSMGKRLGDCSEQPKALRVLIDGKSYEVKFAKNYDGQNQTTPPNIKNAAILDEINAVIGEVATISLQDPATEYYPELKGMKRLRNDDTTAILSGMGVVFTGQDTMRKALHSDGKIDGICLDNGKVKDRCRIITSGETWAAAKQNRFSIRELAASACNPGDQLGISPNNPGVFEAGVTPGVLVSVRKNVYAFCTN